MLSSLLPLISYMLLVGTLIINIRVYLISVQMSVPLYKLEIDFTKPLSEGGVSRRARTNTKDQENENSNIR